VILDPIYDHSIVVSGAALIVVAVLLSWVGVVAVARIFPLEARSLHNEVAGFIIAIIGVVYAVLLAFIAVAVWQNYDNMNSAVDREASLVSNLYRDSIALPETPRAALRADLDTYLANVIDTEWPVQRAGRVKKAGWQTLNHFHAVLAKVQSANADAAVVDAEMLRTLNLLYDARRARLMSSQEGLNRVVWTILLLGGGITVAFSCVFGVPSLRMHLAMTGMLAASLTLVFILIVALDQPFRGSLGIEPTPFVDVQKELAHLPPDD
jgi:hypothetical protein